MVTKIHRDGAKNQLIINLGPLKHVVSPTLFLRDLNLSVIVHLISPSPPSLSPTTLPRELSPYPTLCERQHWQPCIRYRSRSFLYYFYITSFHALHPPPPPTFSNRLPLGVEIRLEPHRD